MKFKNVLAMAAMAAPLVVVAHARGEGRAACAHVTRTSLVRCAVSASLLVERERQGLTAAEARKSAVSPLLPSNPVLAVSGARRSAASREATNWYATLSQELEIAGQRGTRRDAADAAIEAQSKRVALSRRETAALAWTAFFDALAAGEEQHLAQRLLTTTRAVSTAARARAAQGLIAPLDADLADATTVRVLQGKLAADRRVAQTRFALAALLGLDPARATVVVDGALTPLEAASVFDEKMARPAERVEILALDAERRAEELRATALRRSRVPNPTLSIFAQNDGFGERVFGAGVALPLPLPGGVGRTYSGEIAEAEALARRAQSERERVLREIRLEIVTAKSTFQSRADEVAAFSPESLARAEAGLVALGQEVESGRLAVRDAIVAQQTLIELLRANVEARRAWCLASVELARALGLPLERSEP